MKRETLERMDERELDEYGKLLGVELAPCETLEEKLEMIERKRERAATVSALGIKFKIPMKRVHDKRISDIISSKNPSDEDMYTALELMLGGSQTKKLIDACTDDDGTVDSDALGLAFVKILTSDELKNF